MRIIELRAENFKRLRAIEIHPDGSLVVVRGRNAQGKSSVLDAIWAALGGKRAVPAKPIRDGEERSEITLDLGEYVVTRVFTLKDSYLTVKSADGAKIGNPQALLDGLIGAISFDPLEFARMKPTEQARQLAEITGVDFSKLNEERRKCYEERTAINRDQKQLQARINAARTSVQNFNPSEYAEELHVEDVSEELKEAQEEHAAHRSLCAVLDASERDRDATVEKIRRLEEELERLRGELELQEGILQRNRAKMKAQQNALPDLDAITAKFAQVTEHNKIVQQLRSYFALRSELAEAEKSADEMTQRIEAIDRQKADLVAKADLPVNELTFDESGVYYHGVPFDQCSSSEQLKVSTALAVSFNPTLRVIRITDGSLLDDDSLAVLRSIAESEDFQIWLEKVDDSTDGPGIRIEDGVVAEAVSV